MPEQLPAPIEAEVYDPNAYRMSIGDHLEELRGRLIKGIVGFVAALIICLIFGKQMMAIFCGPLIAALRESEINPQIFFTSVEQPFMVYLEISMICALVIASPWILWQVWQFIAAGLYAHERKTVTRYIPLSIALMIGGVGFVYFLVLPWTLQFFLAFSVSIPLPDEFNPMSHSHNVPTTQSSFIVPSYPGDPETPQAFQIWFNTADQRLKFFYNNNVRVLQFGPQNLTAPMITLADYIDLVYGMIATFALSFQLPIVVMALAKIGIIETQTLKGMRKMIYFIMAIVAAVITPGDVITATVALMIPLCLLFELGIFLAERGAKREKTSDADHAAND